MSTKRVQELANNVIARKRYGLDEAMSSVLGEYTQANVNLYNDVWDEVQNILYPHGTGEDARGVEW